MRKIIVFACIFVMMFTSSLWAERVHIDIQSRGFKKLKVAMPAFVGPRGLAGNLWKICAKDLEITGMFSLIDPKGYINPGPLKDIAPGTWKDWILIGADYVIAGEVIQKNRLASLSIEVIELSTSKMLLKKTLGREISQLATRAGSRRPANKSQVRFTKAVATWRQARFRGVVGALGSGASRRKLFFSRWLRR